MTYGRIDAPRPWPPRRARRSRLRLPLLATNDALMHVPARRALARCADRHSRRRTRSTGSAALAANAERHLKSGAEMARLFADAPRGDRRDAALSRRLAFCLDELRGDYPEELREGFATPQAALEFFAREGAKAAIRWRSRASRKAIAHELQLVEELDYAPYFLTVHDIVRFAREQKIFCQGRGSAANSTLCFCLGITEVDPAFHDLLFERFISPERNEPPDIDVDFEHERREDVMQYIYDALRPRAGEPHGERHHLSRALRHPRRRQGLRAFGRCPRRPLEHGLGPLVGRGRGRRDAQAGLDPDEPRLAQALKLAEELIGFPRHLSQHTGGFVITRARLDEVVPIANAAMDERTTIEWDKDDLDALGILKIDVLALGMLTCLRKSFDLLRKHYGEAI